jgi:26S proteasome non-ATPase regulatory subunit 9
MSELKTYEELLGRKIQIEEEISELYKILEEEGNVGMTGKLVDTEGYPRADLDLYKVKSTRQKINCLQNDFKHLMERMEQELIKIHANKEESVNHTSTNITNNLQSEKHKPFLKVTQVDFGSPSFEAGFKLNDKIVQFGPFTISNTRNLSEIAEHVKSKVDKIILVSILRSENNKENSETKMILKLIPKSWNGQGFLGCKLVNL